MATVLKESSDIAKKIRKVEDFLREEGVEISYRPEGIIYRVEIEGVMPASFVILDESHVVEQTTPSFAEPTRIQPIDHYIKGT